ncbi:MAG TPA: FlgD immunoglobulin-like domain containing protein [bacterium]
MADLIEKYFKEDLAEAEQEALSMELESSDGAAEKFMEKAEEAYRRFGLPEPHWTGPDAFPYAAKPGFGKWFWFGVLLVGALGASTWWYFAKHSLTNQALVSPLGSEQVSPIKSAPIVFTPPKLVIKKHISAASQPITIAQLVSAVKPKANVEAPQTALPSLPVLPQTTAMLPLPYTPKFTPVNVDQNPKKTFSRLSVSLHLLSPGSLVVRVLDSVGTEVMPIFNGTLQAGTWAFVWNGLLKDGRLAPPGKYRIEVRSGSWSQIKEILIQK